MVGRGLVHLSEALAGRDVGVRELRDGRLLFAFGSLELAHLGSGTRITPIKRLSETDTAEVSPMCPV